MAPLLPENGRVLDVGVGRFISKIIREKTADIAVEGLTSGTAECTYPGQTFDGQHLPYHDVSFDAVMSSMFSSTDDPGVLICEAARVSKSLLLFKDHEDGFLAGSTFAYGLG